VHRGAPVSGVTYRIEVEQDDIPVRGNALASGDDMLDRETEAEIIRRLNQGDVWAWATVSVIASCEGFEARAVIGGCSYADEADFRAGPYYEDLCDEARVALQATIDDAKARLARAERLLAE